MLKNIIFVLILFLTTDSYSDDRFSIAYFGSLIRDTNMVLAVYQDKNITVSISKCIVSWDDGEPFYIVAIGGEYFAVKKKTYDFLANQYRNDENKIAQDLISIDGICSISF